MTNAPFFNIYFKMSGTRSARSQAMLPCSADKRVIVWGLNEVRKKKVGVCGKERDDSFSGESQTHTGILKMEERKKNNAY